MIVTLNINRIKQENNILEIFSWSPSNSRIIKSDNRRIYHLLRYYINNHAIHKYGYKLLNIIYHDNKILYIYLYESDKYIPKLNEQIEIKYYPVLGKKSCHNCRNYIIYNGNAYCYLRGIKIIKEWVKCMEWLEKEMHMEKNKNVHKWKPTRRNDKTYGRVHTYHR